MSLPQLPPGGAPSAPVPFAFTAEADQFRSNVAPPPRERPSAGQLAGRVLFGLTLIAGLAGSLILGMPALSQDAPPAQTQHSVASDGR
ncbi:hypothetical protein CW362_27380 [Streptomyces populi]|uniref:Uncharacterized protein n=1 Tax=Streptomyces populi TaxID=2058924 RepID=A0A2I0SIZ1_9ACTN|nr:hypothetical protein [Streptomyces populi]PKT69893.1 hypothetical protein CW362_27380 [Streptomyces populi]